MIVYPQRGYPFRPIQGYGCGVVSVVAAVGKVAESRGHIIDEFTAKDMERLLNLAFTPSIMSGNCYIRRWHLLADCVIEVLGLYGKTKRTIFKYSNENNFLTFSDLPTNGYIYQYKQINSKEPYHFTEASFNPDTSLSIEDEPSGLRGLYIDIK